MKYFIANISAHIVIFVGIIVLLVFFTNKNRKRELKFAPLFFVPILLSALAVLDMLFIVGPRLLDLSDVLHSNYKISVGVIEEKSFFNNMITIDGTTYFVNPLHDIPEIGTEVRYKYTDNSDFSPNIIEADESADGFYQ